MTPEQEADLARWAEETAREMRDALLAFADALRPIAEGTERKLAEAVRLIGEAAQEAEFRHRLAVRLHVARAPELVVDVDMDRLAEEYGKLRPAESPILESPE